MPRFDPDWWRSITPYLDEALGIPLEERGGWLSSLREKNADLAHHIETLLEEHQVLASEGFLEGQPTAPLTSPAVAGDSVDAYRLIAEIGRGGMGSVWLAERSDGRFERQVAIKFLNFALAGRGGAARFKREGTILGKLSHLHIAELVDAGVSAWRQPYLVLEYVDGAHIDQYCDEHTLEVQARLRIFLDVLAAVAHAHANLIVHRDIKPSNVLVGKDGQVKLLDFGIAKLLQPEVQAASPTLTREAGGALTPEYAAPEQLTGGAITTATDVYALGVLLYVLLTGRHPVGEGPCSAAELVKGIVEVEPPRASTAIGESSAGQLSEVRALKRSTTPTKLGRLLRDDLDTLLAKALKKDPGERYISVVAFADDVQRYLGRETISARPDTLAYRASKFVRRNRIAVALGSLASVAVIAGSVGTLVQARTARRERDFARRQLLRAEAINDLNFFLLSDASPSGKPFTVNDLLTRAEHILERQGSTNNLNRVDLLISIGREYLSEDQDGKARAVLEKAYASSRSLTDQSARARASCAPVLARAGELVRAESLIQEGLAELPEISDFIPDRVFCLLFGSQVARTGVNTREGIARDQAAQKILTSSPFDNDVLQLRIAMDLAESYRENGQFGEAVPAFQQAAAHLSLLGRDETETAGTLFNNWALTLDLLGRPIDAEPIYRRAIEISRANQSDEGVSPMLLINYAGTLRQINRLDKAAKYAEQGHTKAQQAGYQVAINQSLLSLARIYRDQGDFARAKAMLAQVEPRLRKALPPGHYAFAALASDRATIALKEGDYNRALQFANQALAIDEAAIKSGGLGKGLYPLLFDRRSKIELPMGRAPEAEADATRALGLLQPNTQPGEFSSIIGQVHVDLGLAQQAQGKLTEAAAEFRSGAEHLQKTLGADHPEARRAVQLSQTQALPQQP